MKNVYKSAKREGKRNNETKHQKSQTVYCIPHKQGNKRLITPEKGHKGPSFTGFHFSSALQTGKPGRARCSECARKPSAAFANEKGVVFNEQKLPLKLAREERIKLGC